jgi:hypothetical protein
MKLRGLTMFALVLAVGSLAASDAQAGSALTPPTKTTGSSLNATIVIDVTQIGSGPNTAGSNDDGTGVTSIRVQKASTVTAAIFQSEYVRAAGWTTACTKPSPPPNPLIDVKTTVGIRFTGLIDAFVEEAALTALFSPFGAPHKAAIVDQDYVRCTQVGNRQILSFTAVIQFDVGP